MSMMMFETIHRDYVVSLLQLANGRTGRCLFMNENRQRRIFFNGASAEERGARKKVLMEMPIFFHCSTSQTLFKVFRSGHDSIKSKKNKAIKRIEINRLRFLLARIYHGFQLQHHRRMPASCRKNN